MELAEGTLTAVLWIPSALQESLGRRMSVYTLRSLLVTL